MSQGNDLQRAAINRHRERIFGDSSLKVYSTTPDDGDEEIFEFTKDWKGHRVIATTNLGVKEAGAWQFQIVAAETWETTQTDLLKAVALTIDGRRWKVTKVEQPIGRSLVWKLKAEVQR